MFQFPRFPPTTLCIRAGVPRLRAADCSIRAPPDHRAPAAPRGVSPLGRAPRRHRTPRHPPRAHPCARPSRATEIPRLGRTLRRKHRVLARPSLKPGVALRVPAITQRRLAARSPSHILVSNSFVKVPDRCAGRLTIRCSGGATGARTPNLRRARAALSRLSYGPPAGPARRGARPAEGGVRRATAPGWARLDSNQGPRPYQGRALTA